MFGLACLSLVVLGAHKDDGEQVYHPVLTMHAQSVLNRVNPARE